MIDDIVARLRNNSGNDIYLCEDAADEIERLRAVLGRWMACGCPVCHGDCSLVNPLVTNCIMKDAHAAFASTSPKEFGHDRN